MLKSSPMGKRANIYQVNNNDTWETAVRKINTSLMNIIGMMTLNEATGGGGSSAVKTHQDLGDSVNQPGCHPIAAISNLTESLNNISIEMNKRTTENQAIKAAHPKNSVYTQKSSTLPTSFTEGMTWDYKGTTTIAGTTYHAWERTT